MRSGLTSQYFCLAARPDRKRSNGSMTEGLTRKRDSVWQGDNLSVSCDNLPFPFIFLKQWIILTSVLRLMESIIWGGFDGRDHRFARFKRTMEVFFCLLIVQSGDGESSWSADYSCQWSLGLQHELPPTNLFDARTSSALRSANHLGFLRDCKRHFTKIQRQWSCSSWKPEW